MSSHVEILDQQSVSNTENNLVVYFGRESRVCTKDLDDIANCIVDYYITKSEVCIGELLNSVTIPGLSIEEAAILYAKVYKMTDQDEVVRHSDGYEINLWENEQ